MSAETEAITAALASLMVTFDEEGAEAMFARVDTIPDSIVRALLGATVMAYRTALSDRQTVELRGLVAKLAPLLPGPRGREVMFTAEESALLRHVFEVGS